MPAIHGLNKTTLLDYPGRIAATIFLGSCNFRCPFCQNSSLVLHPADEPVIPEEEILSFLKKTPRNSGRRLYFRWRAYPCF